jgi:hypothetical protein
MLAPGRWWSGALASWREVSSPGGEAEQCNQMSGDDADYRRPTCAWLLCDPQPAAHARTNTLHLLAATLTHLRSRRLKLHHAAAVLGQPAGPRTATERCPAATRPFSFSQQAMERGWPMVDEDKIHGKQAWREAGPWSMRRNNSMENQLSTTRHFLFSHSILNLTDQLQAVDSLHVTSSIFLVAHSLYCIRGLLLVPSCG